MWEHFHHQADIGIRGVGETVAAAFEAGAVALTAVMADPAKVQPEQAVDIACGCDEADLLFADWINALIYEMDVRKMLFSRFDVQIEGGQLTATAWGESADADRHDFAVEVKAATFMELKVFQNEKRLWVAQCVVDV